MLIMAYKFLLSDVYDLHNSKNEVKAAISEISELTQNFVRSMNKRLKTMLEGKGAHTKY